MRTIIVAAGVAACCAAPAIVIDDFTTGPVTHSMTSGSVILQQLGSMAGGQRDLLLTVLTNSVTQQLQQTIGSGMSITSSGTLLTARIGLDYDGVDAENPIGSTFNAGLPGINPSLDISGQTWLRFNFLANDRTLNLQAELTGSGTSTAAVSVAGNQDTPFTVDIPLADFNGTANFATIHRMTFYFNTSPSGDFALGSIEVVPEPSSLLAVGVGMMLLLRRRKGR